ncbi:hypothetical protein C2845_PM07G08180 [Panicum miliaceum]|uniref:DUF569 domain-containing protein n=1 Tax=Panicum miliaceum TaxID=4540 RepID=A0A3L6SRC4_PANMI|nr:hypothetical protein C2845_PM07G08180 [Panicum miliaceum]
MDLFPDRFARAAAEPRARHVHVHLRRRGRGRRLLSARRASLNAAWVVHQIMHNGASFILLHGAAYGRYLALSPEQAPRGHRVIQKDRDDFPDPDAVLWRSIRAWEDDDVLLRHFHGDVQRNPPTPGAATGSTPASPSITSLPERRSPLRRCSLFRLHANHFTLCVQAGSEAPRTPLVNDLPSKPSAMIIIALTTGSPGAAALVYPDVDA